MLTGLAGDTPAKLQNREELFSRDVQCKSPAMIWPPVYLSHSLPRWKPYKTDRNGVRIQFMCNCSNDSLSLSLSLWS